MNTPESMHSRQRGGRTRVVLVRPNILLDALVPVIAVCVAGELWELQVTR